MIKQPGRSVRGILFSALFFLLTAGMAFGVVVLKKIEAKLHDDVLVTNLTLARSIAAQVDGILSRAEKIIIITGDIAKEELTAGRNLDAVLSKFVKATPIFSRLQVLDLKGVVRHSSNRRDLRIGYNFSRHSIDITALSQSESNWSLSHIPLKGKMRSIAISRHFEDFLVVGYLDLTELSRGVQALASEAGVRAVVLDHEGFMVAGAELEIMEKRTDFSGLPYVQEGLEKRFSSGRSEDETGADVIMSTASIKTADLLAVVFRCAEVAMAPVTYVWRTLVGFLVASVIVAILVIFYLYKRIESPLNALSDYTGNVADGQYDLAPSGLNLREFDILKHNFFRMTEAVSMREADLRLARQKAEAAAEARSVFLANMSHELRTPLNAVIGLTDLLLRTDLSQKQYDYLVKSSSSAKSLLGIINDILDFSKLEADKLELECVEFSLEQVLDRVTDIIGIQADQKGIELLYDIEPGMPKFFKGDSLRLGQVLINLATNGVKFTSEGMVVIGVKQLQIPDDIAGSKVELQFFVRDTGIGLTEEQAENLFSPFQQADSSTTRKYGGTGLGLSICKNIVSRMDGDIWVESEPDKGATFFFTTKMDVVQKAQRFIEKREQSQRVLIVDDSRTTREVLRQHLVSWHFDVLEASSVAEAEEMFSQASNTNPVDLVLMDWKMPGVDGVEGTRLLKNKPGLSKVPAVLMITAYGRDEIRQQAEKAGVDGFLVKPINASLLFETIMELLGVEIERQASRAQRDFEHSEKLQAIRGAHVLLVEDNSLNQLVAIEHLKHIGLSVSVANNGLEAVAMSAEGEYDLILMDIQMPEMDGYEATHKIREREKREGHEPTKISAMTAHALNKERKQCERAGMDAYLTKPIELDKLYSILIELIEPREQDELNLMTYSGENIQNDSLVNIPETLPGINIHYALQLLNNNRRFFVNLLHNFVSEFGGSAGKITKAIDASDFETVHSIGHTVKGLAGNLGAETLVAAALGLEEAAEKELLSECSVFLGRYDKALAEVIVSASMCSVKEEKPIAWQEQADGGEDDKKSAFQQLIMLVSGFEMSALDFFLENRVSLAAVISQERMQELEEMLQNYDLDQADDLLRTIMDEQNEGR